MKDTDRAIIIVGSDGHVSFEFDPALEKEERSFRAGMAARILAVFEEDD